jgi:hypothetical protein
VQTKQKGILGNETIKQYRNALFIGFVIILYYEPLNILQKKPYERKVDGEEKLVMSVTWW